VHAVLLEQPSDRVLVVVGEDAAEARLEVLRDREVEDRVERRNAAPARDRRNRPDQPGTSWSR
jgi:hypothetical protein